MSPGRTTRRSFVLASLILAMFMAAIEGTIVATAVPSIAASLGGFELFSWVFSIFLLTQAVTTPVFGKLADLYGRKPVFIVGVLIFLVGSVLCGFAASMPMLIAFRFVQGLGAGAVNPIVTTLAGDLYDMRERARVQGYLSAVWGVSAVVGPLAGGLIVQYAHWAWIFWLNVPFGMLSILGVWLFLHESPEEKLRRVDVIGALLFTVGVGALMLLLTQASSWGTGPLVALGAVALAALAAFFAWERRTPEPLIDLAMWRDRLMSMANLATLTSGVMMIGLITYLPTYVQGVMGGSPLVAGFTLTAMSIGWPISSVVSGRLMVSLGVRPTALIGGVLGLLSGLLFLFLSPERGALYAALASLFMGFGMGFLSTTFIVAIQNSVPWERRGVATATNMFMRILGNAFGAALLGGVLNLSLTRHLAQRGGADSALGDLTLDRMQVLLDPGAGADPALLDALRNSLASGLHAVYIGLFAFTALTLVVTLLLPKRRSVP